MALDRLGFDIAAPDAQASAQIRALASAHSTSVQLSRIVVRGGSGSILHSADGREYLDLIGGYGVASTGWNHPRLLAAARRQTERTLFAPPMFATVEAAALSHALLETMAMPEGWACIRATGGGDANEQVLKAIAADAKRTGKVAGRASGGGGPLKMIRYARSYHGGSSAMLALSDVVGLGLTTPLGQGTHPMLALPTGANEVALVEELADADPSIVGVMVEPVLGSGGVYPFPSDYLRALREVCTRRGLWLVFDEVITGCGRVGAMLHAHRVDVMPDAVTLGKGITAGAAALGAAMVCPKLAEAARKEEDTTSTFAWSPMACEMALENLAIIEDEALSSKADFLGERLAAGVRAVLCEAYGERASVRSVGLMVGATVRREDGGDADPRLVQKIALRCERLGVLVGASWDWRELVLLPPLVISNEEIDRAVGVLGEAIESRRARV